MNIIFNMIIFIIGALLGRIYWTIIKRISKGGELRSYCVNCGEKTKIFEKIPIISYIFFRGKCRHCGKKLEIGYIILEVLTGLIFLAITNGLNIINDINRTNIISLVFILLYVSYIILVSGVDKKIRSMPSALLAYGVSITLIYILYLCIIEEVIYRYVIYLGMIVMLLLANIMKAKKQAQSSYLIDLLTMLIIMLIFTGEYVCILTIIGTLVSIPIYLLIKRGKFKMKKGKTSFNLNIKIVFMMGCLNILSFLLLINIL